MWLEGARLRMIDTRQCGARTVTKEMLYLLYIYLYILQTLAFVPSNMKPVHPGGYTPSHVSLRQRYPAVPGYLHPMAGCTGHKGKGVVRWLIIIILSVIYRSSIYRIGVYDIPNLG